MDQAIFFGWIYNSNPAGFLKKDSKKCSYKLTLYIKKKFKNWMIV